MGVHPTQAPRHLIYQVDVSPKKRAPSLFSSGAARSCLVCRGILLQLTIVDLDLQERTIRVVLSAIERAAQPDTGNQALNRFQR